MDTTFAHAVSKIMELPSDTQRSIGEALLCSTWQLDLPVIEFNSDEGS
jgi:hypothetical protein